MSWTEERVAVLSKLWADGLSASQIAAELGGVTRNAVIGKVHRLGLSGRVKSNSSAPRTKRAGKSSQPKAAKTAVPKTRNNISLRAATGVSTQLDREIDLVAPKSLELSLENLTEMTCKWPAGDPATDDFSFCGVRTKDDGPYCEYHAKLAYQPMADRRRQRRMVNG